MTKHHIVSALNEALKQEMSQDKSIVVLGEDVGVDGGVFRVTDGLVDEFGTERLIDTPLAEAGIIGTAVGLAINGMKPIVEIQFVGFSYQGFHHINHHMSRFRQRTEGAVGLPMVLRAPYGGGIRALELHSESPETFFAHSMGLKVVVPSNPYDAKGLLISAIRDHDPVIFLEPEKLYRSFREDVPEEQYTVPIGKANVVKEGKDITIISWGSMLHLCKETLEDFEKEGIDVELIDLRTIYPLDMETILTSVKKTSRVVIVQEAPRSGGWASEIVARIQEKAILHLDAPIGRVTGFDVPYPQFALETVYLPGKKRILTQVKETLNF
ncbi:MAG: alpha-ketoacid dehydrogenase subunit beta [Candidatus Woesearchaeota archaeon]